MDVHDRKMSRVFIVSKDFISLFKLEGNLFLKLSEQSLFYISNYSNTYTTQ